MAKYSLLTVESYNENVGHYTSYGIKFAENNKTFSIEDISTDKFAVEQLIENFNINKLDSVHLSDAIEDYLYDLDIK